MYLYIRDIISPKNTIDIKLNRCSISLDVNEDNLPVQYTDENAQDAVFPKLNPINGLSGSYNTSTNVYTIQFGEGSSEGDMWYRGPLDVLTSVPIGTNGQVLKVSGGIPSWQSVSLVANTVLEYITSGDGILTSFDIPHGLGAEPNATVMAASADAAHIAYITKDATNITVYYDVAPPSGTNNLKFNYIANI